MKKSMSLVGALFLALLANAQQRVTLTVTNLIKSARLEMVEVDVSAIQKKLYITSPHGENSPTDGLIVTDADGKEIPSQLTWDGKLIFQAGVGAKAKSIYHVQQGMPHPYEVRAKGRLFTERQDEFGWENDRVAYRVYGHGGAVGYDLFNKSTSDLMLDYWYASEQNQEMRSVGRQLTERGYPDLADQLYNAYSYHVDHGKGMDCYTVGPTLGGGANALLGADGALLMPPCYKTFEILDQGPLRFTVRFTYPTQDFNGQPVTETRIVTLDAGSHFNRASVAYEGLATPVQMAAGIVVHQSNPTAYVLSSQSGYIGDEVLGDPTVYHAKYRDEFAAQMGRIYVGLLFPDSHIATSYQQRPNGIATGHILATATVRPATAYTYYFGSGWSGNPNTDFHTLTDWEAYLSRAAQGVRTPLKVSLK